jgi:hypothetical protein
MSPSSELDKDAEEVVLLRMLGNESMLHALASPPANRDRPDSSAEM